LSERRGGEGAFAPWLMKKRGKERNVKALSRGGRGQERGVLFYKKGATPLRKKKKRGRKKKG